MQRTVYNWKIAKTIIEVKEKVSKLVTVKQQLTIMSSFNHNMFTFQNHWSRKLYGLSTVH